MMVFALVSASLLLLLLPGCQPDTVMTSFEIVVENSLQDMPLITYTTQAPERGILIGGLKRLMASNESFTFTYSEFPDYGPYLVSVNGLPGSTENNTYWQLMVKTPHCQIVTPDVGIGCYIPSANEKIILQYSTY